MSSHLSMIARQAIQDEEEYMTSYMERMLALTNEQQKAVHAAEPWLRESLLDEFYRKRTLAQRVERAA